MIDQITLLRLHLKLSFLQILLSIQICSIQTLYGSGTFSILCVFVSSPLDSILFSKPYLETLYRGGENLFQFKASEELVMQILTEA